MKKAIALLVFTVALCAHTPSFAWSKKGHELVAEIAFHFLDSATRAKVQHYLTGMRIEAAATWMDDIRKDRSLSYMSPWHYINIEKDGKYRKVKEANIINILDSVIRDLKKNPSLPDSSIKRDLLIIFHLAGDLHQPLHVGYGSDKGGNDAQVSVLGKGSNLHTLWDRTLIEQNHIDLDSCLALYPQFSGKDRRNARSLNLRTWLNQSRDLLPQAYGYDGHIIDQAYLDRNRPVVEKQLLLAGLRLAAVLQKVMAARQA
jgi:hypothetical protein